MTLSLLITGLALLGALLVGALVFKSTRPRTPCRCGSAQPNHLDDNCLVCRQFLDAQAWDEYRQFKNSF